MPITLMGLLNFSRERERGELERTWLGVRQALFELAKILQTCYCIMCCALHREHVLCC